MEKNDLQGHRKRLRQRFLQAGLSGMHDYEALELLLTFVIPRRDVKPIAKEMLKKFKSLSGVFDASLPDLLEVDGIAENSAVLLLFIKDICGEYLAGKMQSIDVLSTPDAVCNFARMKLGGLKNEAFMVVYLNTKNHVIASELMNQGTVDHAAVYPRNIVVQSLKHHAAGLILIHNHPSGCCDPSSDDVRLTEIIQKAVGTVGIKVLDHIITGKSGYFSFVEEGLL